MSSDQTHRILVPTDLSDFGKPAARWADLMQQRLGGRITLMFADEPYAPFDVLEGPATWVLQTAPGVRERLSRELNRFAAENFRNDGADVDTLIVEDSPARAIVRTAEEIDADLIVMATHGRRGWRRAILGSVTENVVHRSDRAVVCVPPAATPHDHPKLARILCPVNFTSIGRQGLEEAAAMAGTFSAELLVVYVADEPDDPRLVDVDKDFTAWIEPGIRNRCLFSQIIARGDVAGEILSIAGRYEVDLIVIGAQRERFGDTTVIGTTTEHVIRLAKTPVLMVMAPVRAADVRSSPVARASPSARP